MELTQTEQQNEKRTLKRKDTLWDCQDSIQCDNIHIIVPSEGKEKEKMPPKLTEETVAENVLNVGKEKDIPIQKATEFQIR